MIGFQQAIRTTQREASRRDVSTRVKVHWVEVSDGVEDPVTREIEGGTRTDKVEERRALVHESQASGINRHGAEVEAGDLTIDFIGDVDLSTRRELRFEVDGVFWVPKRTPNNTVMSAVAMAGGRTVCTSIVCRRRG